MTFRLLRRRSPVAAQTTESTDNMSVDTPVLCPTCGGTLRLEMRPGGKQVGHFVLAGQRFDLNVNAWPWVCCESCGIAAPARYEAGTVND